MKIRFQAFMFPLVLAAAVDVTRPLRSRGSGKGMMNGKKGYGKSGSGKMAKKGGQHHKDYHCETVEHRKADDDLGYRFNKFEMVSGYSGGDVYLDWSSYPLSDDLCLLLQYESNAYSVISKYDYELHGVCIEKYIHAIGGYPIFPSCDPSSPFWEDLGEVVEAQILRRNGMLPRKEVLTLPTLWEDWTAYEVAEAVHDEFLGTHHVALLIQLLNQGLELDYDILPFRCNEDFIGKKVRVSTLNTWSIGAVAPINFMAKWHVGRARPEEVAWLIAKGEINTNCANPDVVDAIKSMGLTGATSFTQYPEGSPLHPSWPAMHSAASSMSLWLAVVANLTPEQYCQVLRTDYAVAYARTIAGVHYPSDNYAGLNMGQEVIAEKLAEHLAETYGSNIIAVQEKIDRLRFDWRTFDSLACTVEPLQWV